MPEFKLETDRVIFTEHHGDHTHQRETYVPYDLTYLADKVVTWHFQTDEAKLRIKVWTTNPAGQHLAELEVNPAQVPFNTAFGTLYDATLDVLSAGECD